MDIKEPGSTASSKEALSKWTLSSPSWLPSLCGNFLISSQLTPTETQEHQVRYCDKHALKSMTFYIQTRGIIMIKGEEEKRWNLKTWEPEGKLKI